MTASRSLAALERRRIRQSADGRCACACVCLFACSCFWAARRVVYWFGFVQYCNRIELVGTATFRSLVVSVVASSQEVGMCGWVRAGLVAFSRWGKGKIGASAPAASKVTVAVLCCAVAGCRCPVVEVTKAPTGSQCQVVDQASTRQEWSPLGRSTGHMSQSHVIALPLSMHGPGDANRQGTPGLLDPNPHGKADNDEIMGISMLSHALYVLVQY